MGSEMCIRDSDITVWSPSGRGDDFALRHGLTVARGQAVAVGSAAWRRLRPQLAGSTLVTGEIKRVYVTPPARRHGVARELMLELEQNAHAAGIERLVLETGPMQPAAIALYRDLGYTDTNGGGWSEYGDHLGVVILEALLPRG